MLRCRLLINVNCGNNTHAIKDGDEDGDEDKSEENEDGEGKRKQR